jgi:hypothetical protein
MSTETPTVDETFRADQYVSIKPYSPKNLMVFVIQTPIEMGAGTKVFIHQLFEHNLQGLSGLVAGHELALNGTGTQWEMKPYAQEPAIVVREIGDKEVHRGLVCWVSEHVVKRSIGDNHADGVNLLAVECTDQGDDVLHAWLLRGVVPENTGRTDAARDLGANSASDVVYYIPLHCSVEQSDDILHDGRNLIAAMKASPVDTVAASAIRVLADCPTQSKPLNILYTNDRVKLTTDDANVFTDGEYIDPTTIMLASLIYREKGDQSGTVIDYHLQDSQWLNFTQVPDGNYREYGCQEIINIPGKGDVTFTARLNVERGNLMVTIDAMRTNIKVTGYTLSFTRTAEVPK